MRDERYNDRKNKFPLHSPTTYKFDYNCVYSYFPNIRIFLHYSQYHQQYDECIVPFQESHIGIDIEQNITVRTILLEWCFGEIFPKEKSENLWQN